MYFKIENLRVCYNKVIALDNFSMTMQRGDFVTLIGPNGAGKSTALRAISGLTPPMSGGIYFDGKSIESLAPDAIVRLGIAQVPEGRRIFKDLTVLENLHLGAFIHRDKKQIRQDLNSVFTCFPRLRERKNQQAGTMSGGEQQMLVIGRALMSRPQLLLLDEPSLGLAPIIVQEIAQILTNINKNQQVSIILVEQNADLALNIADYAYVLESGQLVLCGATKDLVKNNHVQNAYLGI